MENMVLQKVWQQGQRLTVDDLSGCAFTGENAAHTFEISGKNASGAVAISGTIAGKFLRSDNVTVPVTGTASDGVASITLTEDCYAVPGRFIFSVYANDGTHNICIYCGVGTVLRTDSGEYEGGEIITDVTALINAIETAVATIPADYSTLLAAIAPTFSTSTAYPAGSYVWYDGTMYKFTAAHAAGSWTGTDAVSVSLAGDVADLKSAVNAYNYDVPGLSWSLGSYDSSTGNKNTGVTNRICTDYLVPGEDGYLYVATTDPTNVSFWVNRYTDANVFDSNIKSNSDLSYDGYNKGKHYTISVRYKNNATVTDVSALSSLVAVKTHFVGYDNLDANLQEAADIALEKTEYLKGTVATNTDLNTIITPGIYSLAASRNYPNRPPEIKTGSILRVTPYSPTIIKQRIENLPGDILMDRRLSEGSWTDWKFIQYNYPAVFRNIGTSADEWVAGSCDINNGNVTLSTTRISLLYIPVNNPQNNLMITLKNSAAKFWVTRFDNDLNYVSTVITPSSTVGVSVLIPGYVYCVTLAYAGNDTITDINIDTLISYIDIKSILTKQTEIYKDHDYDSFLTGKKWAVCGDSYSEGDYSGESSVNNYTIRNGKYFGELCVYSYLIGNRTGANIEMLARRGMTLASVPAKQGNCFVEGAYQTIPSDADYITLWFGINDKLQSVEIGDESSTDITTFCGAWNTVLSYIRANHPFTHVGIVVSNNAGSAQAPYSAATRTMAKKYGYPVLDMQADTQIPLMLNDMERDGLASSVRTQVYNAQALANGHPNAQAHEFESYFIENWLHSL